jgi:hypothetical protein
LIVRGATLRTVFIWLTDLWERLTGWLTDPRKRRPNWDRKTKD